MSVPPPLILAIVIASIYAALYNLVRNGTLRDLLGTVEPGSETALEGLGELALLLDAEGRCVRSMRTFIQAAPGTTRSCVGCHEEKAEEGDAPTARRASTPSPGRGLAPLASPPPSRIEELGAQ